MLFPLIFHLLQQSKNFSRRVELRGDAETSRRILQAYFFNNRKAYPLNNIQQRDVIPRLEKLADLLRDAKLHRRLGLNAYFLPDKTELRRVLDMIL